MKTAWDKILLVGIAVAVIAVSGLFVFKAISFSKEFTRDGVAENNTLPENDLFRVKEANEIVKSTAVWQLPQKGTPAKPLPLFKSITIVEAEGKLIDMTSPDAELIRPPVSNQWLIENDLPFLNASVLSQDADSDGFSNLEEWNEKTSPTDLADHPSYTSKLFVKERKSKGYTLRFAAKPDAERFQVIREPSAAWPRRETFILRIGDISGDDQFRVEAYEQKEELNPSTGIREDASVLTVTYMPTAEKIALVRNTPENIPTYFGVLSFDLGTVEPQFIKEGEAFTLSIDQKNKYRLLKIEEKSAKISVETENGEEKIVEIATKS